MTAPTPIRLLIVDDHFATRLGLTLPINSEPDMEVIAEASTGSKAVEQFRKTRPDVVLLDYRLPDQTGVEVLETIRSEFPDARIIILTMFDGEEDVYRAVQAGAMGYVTKSAECEEVLGAIRSVAAGESFFSAEVAEKLKAREKRKPLTPREIEILRLLVKGLSTKDIVNEMSMSMGTIRLHISMILEKLEAFDRTRAVAIAIERGIVHVGE